MGSCCASQASADDGGFCCAQSCGVGVEGEVVYPVLSGTLKRSAQLVPRNITVLRTICDRDIPKFLCAPDVQILEESIRTPRGMLRLEWLLPAETQAPRQDCDMLSEISSSSLDSGSLSDSSSGSDGSRGMGRSSSCIPARCRRILLYMHGGAFVLCTPGTLRGCTSPVARALGAAVCVPEYERPPEATLHESIEDGLATYRHLRQAHPDSQILLGGESAGGSLAASMLLALRDNAEPLPHGVFLMSPWTDLSGEDAMAGLTHADCSQEGDYLPASLVAWIARQARGDLPGDRPPASPMYAEGSLADLPPIFVLYGKAELLCQQIEHFCTTWAGKGARVKQHGVEGGTHAPVLWNFCHGHSSAALGELAGFFAEACPAPE